MQLLRNNPCREVTLPKPDGEKREVYTLEEIQQLLDLLHKESEGNFKYVLFYTLAIYTGFRCGELSALERQSFFINYRFKNKLSGNSCAEYGKLRTALLKNFAIYDNIYQGRRESENNN